MYSLQNDYSIGSVFLSLETRMNEHYDKLNQNDKEILSYILKNKAEVSDTTIISLAEKTLTSKSSIMRLTKKLGYSGYSELKYNLESELSRVENSNIQSFSKSQEEEINTTKKLFDQMDLLPLLEKIYKAERIYCYGTGWAQRDILSNLKRSMIALNIDLILINSSTELGFAADNMTKDDLVIIVSLSGDIKGSQAAIESLNVQNVPILSITDLNNNKYAAVAEYNLYCNSKTFNFNELEIESLFSFYVVTDLLYRKYAEYVMELEK